MFIVSLTDVHGKLRFLEAIGDDLKSADVVLLPGDLTMFGRRKDAEEIVGAVEAYNPNIFAVMGNCDYPEVEAYLEERGMCLHRRHVVVDGVAFAGLGGSLHCPVPTLNEWTEEETAAHLSAAGESLPEDMPLVLVSHQPPLNTVVDLAGIGLHVGSQSVRDFIEKYTPLVCFSGHIHEATGTDTIGETHLINPGPFMDGHFAFVELDSGVKRIETRHAGA